jgi:hypothetical protein
MTCAHKCGKCGYTWDCAFTREAEHAETPQEAFKNGWEGCNNWCPNCEPNKRQQQIERDAA